MAIIISKDGKNAKKVDKSPFKTEDYLQKYIYDNPDSIPLYDIKEDIHLLILAREFPSNSGPIDAIGIDKDGSIYLIETKLYKNPDKRLVVAQVLDYGASLWRSYNNFDEFIRAIENKLNKTFGMSLYQKLANDFRIDDDGIQVLIENFKRNLNEGNFKFVVLMDNLYAPLKDLIIFINENSRFDIFAVEMEYYKYENHEIMIPKLFGAEVKKNIGVSSSCDMRRSWDEQSFFEDASNKLKEHEMEAVEKIYEFSKNNADIIKWGTGNANASFNPIFSKISATTSLYTVKSDGILILNFGWLNKDKTAIQYRDAMKKQLEKIFPIDKDEQKEWPGYRINLWWQKADEFIAVVRDLIGK